MGGKIGAKKKWTEWTEIINIEWTEKMKIEKEEQWAAKIWNHNFMETNKNKTKKNETQQKKKKRNKFNKRILCNSSMKGEKPKQNKTI